MNDLTFDEVVTAYYDCRKNKRNTSQQIKFEFHLERNLWNLYEELKNGTYVPGSHIFFILTKPKLREVWAATFKDRIVHHIIYNRTIFIENDYIKTNFACLRNRGTLAAAYSVKKALRTLWKERENYRVLQVDISNFYVSIDKQKLKHILFSRIENEYTRNLIGLFLNQNPCENYHYKGDVKLRNLIPEYKSLIGKETGLPIGNLTSQIFANYYLNDFDWFVKREITPYYFRYMDDLLLLIPKSQKISDALDKMNVFLKSHNLILNPKKTKHNRIDSGANFAGYIIKPFSIYTRNSTKNRAKLAVKSQSINSYYGLFRKVNCYNLRKSIALQNGLSMLDYRCLA